MYLQFWKTVFAEQLLLRKAICRRTGQWSVLTCWIVVSLLLTTLDRVHSEILHAIACPGKDLHLYCTNPNQKIVLHKADYGTILPALTCDTSIQTPGGVSCIHPDPLGALSRSCFRKKVCKISPMEKAEVFNFLDPCPGLERYLSVSYSCVEDSAILSICDRQSTAIEQPLHGYVMSQNYPDHYYNGRSCRRSLKGREGQVISIDLLDLELEYSNATRQCYDFIVFHQLRSGGAARTYCGSRRGENDMKLQYPLDSVDEVMVSFESSIEDRYRGFLFEYQVTGCPTEDVPDPPYNGLRLNFIASTSAQYGCNQGYELLSATKGLLTCEGVTWKGDAGFCLKIDKSTTTTTTTIRTTTVSSTSLPKTTTKPSTLSTSTRRTTTATVTEPAMHSVTINKVLTSSRDPGAMTMTETTETSRGEKTTRKPSNGPPIWAMEPLGTSQSPNGTDDSTKKGVLKPIPGTSERKEDGNIVLLAAIVGGVSFVLLIAIIVAGVIVRRKIKKKQQAKSSGLSSLRPSAHACVSIPNTYAGVGYAAAKSASYSSSSERNSIIAASSSARNSSSRSSSNLKTSSDEISYESDIYERARAESLKGSADPILTNSETSFDCVDVTLSNVKVPDVDTTYLKPLSCTTSSQAPLVFNAAEMMDSDLLYPIARPSLETIHEEHEGEGTMPRATPAPALHNTVSVPGSSCSSFTFQRVEGDGHSNPSYQQHEEEETSQRSIDSDIKPKVELRRIRTRPISMGEADQPESKRRIQKVEYALFKDDDTGNLGNFLDQRRVSV